MRKYLLYMAVMLLGLGCAEMTPVPKKAKAQQLVKLDLPLHLTKWSSKKKPESVFLFKATEGEELELTHVILKDNVSDYFERDDVPSIPFVSSMVKFDKKASGTYVFVVMQADLPDDTTKDSLKDAINFKIIRDNCTCDEASIVSYVALNALGYLGFSTGVSTRPIVEVGEFTFTGEFVILN